MKYKVGKFNLKEFHMLYEAITQIVYLREWDNKIKEDKELFSLIDNEDIAQSMINDKIIELEKEGFEIKTVVPMVAAYVDTYVDGGAGASLTDSILIMAKRPTFHYSKGIFLFEEDRLRFNKDYLKLFSFFKENSIKVNLICNNGDIQENILQNKIINKNNMEITTLSNIKDNLQNLPNNEIIFKVICIGDREYNLLLNTSNDI